MKLVVTFSRGKERELIITKIVRDTGVLSTVKWAVIDSSEGEAIIDVPDDQGHLVRESMTKLGATVRILEHSTSALTRVNVSIVVHV